MADTANAFDTKVFPGNADMLVGNACLLCGFIGRSEIAPKVEALFGLKIALFDVFSMSPIRVRLLGADTEHALELVELSMGLGDIDVVGVG